jgi:hypothetical protein
MKKNTPFPTSHPKFEGEDPHTKKHSQVGWVSGWGETRDSAYLATVHPVVQRLCLLERHHLRRELYVVSRCGEIARTGVGVHGAVHHHTVDELLGVSNAVGTADFAKRLGHPPASTFVQGEHRNPRLGGRSQESFHSHCASKEQKKIDRASGLATRGALLGLGTRKIDATRAQATEARAVTAWREGQGVSPLAGGRDGPVQIRRAPPCGRSGSVHTCFRSAVEEDWAAGVVLQPPLGTREEGLVAAHARHVAHHILIPSFGITRIVLSV